MHEDLSFQERIDTAEKLYYAINPTTRMDVPSIAYEKVEDLYSYYKKCESGVNFYDFCYARLT